MNRAPIGHARAPREPQPVTGWSLTAPVTGTTPSGHPNAPNRARTGHMGASHGALRCLAVAVPSTYPAGALSVPASVTGETPEGPR